MSERVMANAKIAGAKLDAAVVLYQPSLPQANEDGVIDVAALSPGDFVVVRIPNGQTDLWHPTPGDTIWAYLTDAQSGITVTSAVAIVVGEPNLASWDARLDPAKIPNGTYHATYQKWNSVDDVAGSAPTPVTIAGSSAVGYPGPTFPDATNGVLFYGKTSRQGGAQVRTTYDLQQNDQVTFHWIGVDKWGRDVPAAAYHTHPPLNVSEQDVHNGYIADTVPFANIRRLGNLGSGSAYYDVQRQGLNHTSLNANVVTSWSDIAALQLTSTVGAPKASVQPTDLYPCNSGAVFGEPGLPVTVSVSRGQIVEADSGDPTVYRTQLDENGLASFSVTASNDRVVVISAFSKNGGAPLASATFFDYQQVNTAGIKQYAYTTSAPSDGVSTCTVYLQVMDAFNSPDQTVTATITDAASGAQIVGTDPNSPHTAQIYLNDDGSAFVQIVDTRVEKVHVTLSVTGQEDVLALAPLEFIQFPFVPSR
jgi:hypothetical protein